MGDEHGNGFSDRLKEYEGRLRRAREGIQEKDREQARNASPLGAALRLASELVVAAVVGGGLGWVLDYWLGTGPLFLLLLFAFGVAAGMRNVIRTANRMQAGAEQTDGDAGGNGGEGPRAP